MKVLIVDDHEEHIGWLRSFFRLADPLAMVDATDDLRQAWAHLTSPHRYDLLFVRHDINREPQAGGDLLRRLIECPDMQMQMATICHGLNVVNDTYNVEILLKAGRLARWLPLSLPDGWRAG